MQRLAIRQKEVGVSLGLHQGHRRHELALRQQTVSIVSTTRCSRVATWRTPRSPTPLGHSPTRQRRAESTTNGNHHEEAHHHHRARRHRHQHHDRRSLDPPTPPTTAPRAAAPTPRPARGRGPRSPTGPPATTTPADPDNRSGEDNLANLIQIGEGWTDTADSAYRQKVSDGWKRFTAWPTSDTAPAVGANEEAGHRYEQEVGNNDAAPATEGTPAVPGTPAVTGHADRLGELLAQQEQGHVDGAPSYPTDSRGTWNVKDKIPGGHAGPDGVYQSTATATGRGSTARRVRRALRQSRAPRQCQAPRPRRRRSTPSTSWTCTPSTTSTAGLSTSGAPSRALLP